MAQRSTMYHPGNQPAGTVFTIVGGLLAAMLCVGSVFGANTVTIGPNKEFRLNGKPFFPLMQWLQNDFMISSQKQYGFNLYAVPGNNVAAVKWCDSALKNNVYACCSWNAGNAASVVNHNGFFGWFFGDEPDLQSNAVPPDSVGRQYQQIKKADANHVAFLTVTASFYSKQTLPAWVKGKDSVYCEYPKYADAIGFDLYPVYGWCRPDWVYQVGDAQTELVRKYAKNQKTTYQWIECVKTSGQWCSIPARGTNDGPYDYEIENETWLAIIHGANAIGYFTHSWKCPGYSQFCISDTQGAMLKKVNGRITALTNVLCSADAPDSIKTTITGVGGGSGRVDVKAKIFGDSLYLIAANVLNMTGAADSQRVTFTIPNSSSAITVLFENRSLTLSGNTFTDGFGKRSSVRIYALKTGPTSVSRKGRGYTSALFNGNQKQSVFDIRGRAVDNTVYRNIHNGVYIIKDDHGNRIVLSKMAH